eukprot:GILI01004249.1.p1 GENE.GILI01004249.1~~GILI01004249.1.p1  ORF type:complete len:239 (+),score=60.94 GILI01004249.1:71-787(+)
MSLALATLFRTSLTATCLRLPGRGIAPLAVPAFSAQRRFFSEQSQTSEQKPAENATPAADEVAKIKEELEKVTKSFEEMKQKNADLQDKLLRSLAEAENVRTRTTKEIENSKKYGVQKFASGLLDVADNLTRAAENVPEEIRAENAIINEEDKYQVSLKNLYDGIVMTHSQLNKSLGQAGISVYNPIGQKFDPNVHEVLFDVEDKTKEPGTIAVVIQTGYMIHERVLRPAKVGTVRKH